MVQYLIFCKVCGETLTAHPMLRTKGSKARKLNAYAGRTSRIRHEHGKNCYTRWGKLGGTQFCCKRAETIRLGLEKEVDCPKQFGT